MNNFKIKNNFSIFLRDYLLSISLIVLCFLSDRISKIKIIQQQENGSTLYINDFINFDLVWNTGIGFGLFNSLSSLVYNVFTFLIGLVLIFLIYLFFEDYGARNRVSYAELWGQLFKQMSSAIEQPNHLWACICHFFFIFPQTIADISLFTSFC